MKSETHREQADRTKKERVEGRGGGREGEEVGIGEGRGGHTFSGKKIGNQLIMPGLFVSIVNGLVLSSTPG